MIAFSLSNLQHVRDTCSLPSCSFIFNATATTEIYTLSLHDALPISPRCAALRAAIQGPRWLLRGLARVALRDGLQQDRKSTRLNSSHVRISYAVFCLKKKSYCRPAPSADRSGRRVRMTPLPSIATSP